MSLAASPLTINGLGVKNRFLRSATMENMALPDGTAAKPLFDLYRELAAGGTGLVVSGATAVAEEGKAWRHQLGAWSDEHLPGLCELAQTVAKADPSCAMAVQLHHNGSAGLGYSYGGVKGIGSPRDLTDGDIKGIIAAFGAAAGRVKKAGFQAVAVHGAHGYLVSEFLSRALNTRDDQWGGSLANRLRFPLEVLRAIRAQVGDDYPVLWKMNSDDYLDGGSDLMEYAEAAATLAQAGVDLVEISGGVKDQIKLRARLKKEAGQSEAYFGAALAAFRKSLPAKTACAVTGGLRSLAAVESILANGADMAGMCRPLIREPHLVNQFLSQPSPRPARCTDCCNCLLAIANNQLSCRQQSN